MIPKDPVMLLSFINLKLRDYYSDLDALCEDFKDFISGLLLGLSIAEMLVGVYIVGKSLAGR